MSPCPFGLFSFFFLLFLFTLALFLFDDLPTHGTTIGHRIRDRRPPNPNPHETLLRQLVGPEPGWSLGSILAFERYTRSEFLAFHAYAGGYLGRTGYLH